MTTLLLRATQRDDAPAIVALTQAAYTQNHAETGLYDYVYSETPERLETERAERGWHPLLLEDAGVPVGAVRVRYSDPEAIDLARLSVLPERHGQGLGRLLIAAVEGMAAAWGRQWVTLGALEAAPRNQALYRSLGYEPFGRREMRSAPGNFYTLLRKPIPPRAPNPTVARYEAIADDYLARLRSGSWLEQQLDTFAAALPAPATVLDLGCGPGRDTRRLQALGYSVIALDPTAAMLRLGPESALKLRGDARALPLADASLDGAWASASLLHLSRLELVMALMELRRCIRPGGALFCSFKQGSGEEVRDGRHFAFYQADEITRALRGAGFAPEHQWLAADERPGAPDWITTVARA